MPDIFQEKKRKSSILPHEIENQVFCYKLLFFVNQCISFLPPTGQDAS